jgi:hypothetical protein
MDSKPNFSDMQAPIPANTTHDPISPSKAAPNPIGVRESPLDEPGRLRDVPGADKH